MSNYIIITPANNEAAFIEQTITSMVGQTVRPLRWVIVNDASTDRTREIVESHMRRHSFIELVNVERATGRHFGNKVRAFNAGFDRVKDLSFDFVGNLDADVSFEPKYFENVLKQFAADPKLGLAGGMVHSCTDGEYVSQKVALDSVAGAVQLFRRECFERVGGYRPLPNGGIDAAAEIAARMHGWTTRTFAEFPVKEHRLTGSATARPLASRVKEGRRMHSLGYGLLFFLFRCLYLSRTKPMILGSVAALYGYIGSALSRSPVALPPDVVRFLRNEQHGKLKRAFGLKTN